MTIQLDMFEVQLGAGVLLQFRVGDDVVRVLVDAGVTASDYPKDRVLTRLPDAFAAFGNTQRRIDLIIGTHYDADHLLGLPPIIADPSFDIGEIWLPPVANDARRHALDESPEDHDLLGLQLKADDTGTVLVDYLTAKSQVCAAVRDLERTAAKAWRSELAADLGVGPREFNPEGPEDWLGLFEGHLADALARSGQGGGCHADEVIVEGEDAADEQRRLYWPMRYGRFGYSDFGPDYQDLKNAWAERADLAEAHTVSLAYIRKSAAKDAINALALNAVVTAAKARGLTIRCATIPDGMPRRFIWRAASRRFEPNEREAAAGPELFLLGPSDGLVKKHWDRLPLGDYVAKLAFTSLPLKSITPSNQLSYVCVFRYAEQGLLISGDAGFVDFKPRGRGAAYYPCLIDRLRDLDVVQVAHHGGLNHSFYNCLLAAGLQQASRPSYMLLSHAYQDKTRPSDIFGKFIAQVRDGVNDPKLLFTSQPTESHVRDFKTLFAPVVGPAGNVGDVRLQFSAGWSVLAHAVSAP